MDIVKRVMGLYEALDNSSLTNKTEIKAEVKCCIDAMMHYFAVVSDEKIYYLENTKDNADVTFPKIMEKKRSESHDHAINACGRLNEICRDVSVDVICDFDTNDRRKVAEFCGVLVGELFFSNINNAWLNMGYICPISLSIMSLRTQKER